MTQYPGSWTELVEWGRASSVRARLVLGLSALAALVFGAVTLLALEGKEVVVVRTGDGAGHVRATRTWVADADGAVFVEAANPERPFLKDLEHEPIAELARSGMILPCRATIAPNPAGHRRIRELLAARYGWADRWVALLADTSRSVAVRLDCDASVRPRGDATAPAVTR